MPDIPPRTPAADPFPGVLCRIHGTVVLTHAPPPDAEIIARGVELRYGARVLGKPSLSIVPGLIVLERGEMMTGDEAWAFLTKRSQLFPRAEVYGDLDTGADEMLYVKQLDLALPAKVLAYADGTATVPLAEATALLGQAGGFPERAASYLPIYATVDDLPA